MRNQERTSSPCQNQFNTKYSLFLVRELGEAHSLTSAHCHSILWGWPVILLLFFCVLASISSKRPGKVSHIRKSPLLNGQ